MALNSYDIDTIHHISNNEVVRRLLIKYFTDKGFAESFDRQLYPALIQDMPLTIPSLANKVEIVPHAENVDTSIGKAVLGWNMFVLGNHRMYLGETFHNNLQDLARQIQSGIIKPPSLFNSARRQTTPRRVVTFITRVLGEHEDGFVDLNPNAQRARKPGEPYAAKQSMMGMPQQFYARSGYGT